MKLPKNFTTVTPLSKTLAMVFFILLPFLGFYVGMLYQKQADIVTQFVIQPQNAPSPSLSALSSMSDWKTYTNQKIGLRFKYPSSYKILEDSPNNVVLGLKLPADKQATPYLTISTTQKINSSLLDICTENSQKFPCLSVPTNVSHILVGKIDAVSFDIQKGRVDADFRVVQTSNPKLEMEMDISGGGLAGTFNQMLSTVEFFPFPTN